MHFDCMLIWSPWSGLVPFLLYTQRCTAQTSPAKKGENKNRLCSRTCGIDKFKKQLNKNVFNRAENLKTKETTFMDLRSHPEEKSGKQATDPTLKRNLIND